jgi:pilus assembly protein CpaB
MQRRIIAAVVAVILAGVGAVLLYSYVNTADARAMATLETTPVLVATKVIPAGTSGANLAPFVELRQLPRVAVVEGAITSVADIAELEATSDLQVGEQVLASRFAKPNVDVTGSVEVPSDLTRFTIQLGGTRIIGNNIKAGDRIALYVSGDLGKGESVTKLAFRDVLVANIQGAPAAAPAGDEPQALPGGDLMLTLAATPKVAGQIIWATEFAKIYAALEPKDGDHSSNPLAQVKSIVK